MNVSQICFLNFLKSNGIEPDYVDSFAIGCVMYYFGQIKIVFQHGCVPEEFVKVTLPKFSLTYNPNMFGQDCLCNW